MPFNKQLFFEYVGEFLMVFLPRQIGRSDNTIRSYKHGLNMKNKFPFTGSPISILSIPTLAAP